MRYKRLPNGFGSVVKLSGKRRYPYNARTPVKQYTITGQPICNSLGCYKTRQEAIDAITEWHRQGGEVYATDSTTFAEVYEYMMSRKTLSKNSVNSFTNAYRKLETLYQRPIRKLKLVDLQNAIDNSNHLSKSAVNLIILVIKQVYKCAMQNDIVEKDYSKYLVNNGGKPKHTGDKFYSLEELKVLKDNIDDDGARLVLTMCYSGFRPSAYQTLEVADGKHFKGGIKTKQSKDRIVPIKEELLPLCRYSYSYNNLRLKMEATCEKYGLRKLTPHATRHTFKYLCDKSGVDGITCRILMGHATGTDVHDGTYSHRTTEELEQAIKSLEW